MSDEQYFITIDTRSLTPERAAEVLAEAQAIAGPGVQIVSAADMGYARLSDEQATLTWGDVTFQLDRLEIDPSDRVPLGFMPHEGMNRAQRRAAKRKGRGRGR